MAEELGERTERPTERKRSEARRRGNVARSADFSAAVDLTGAIILLVVLGSGVATGLAAILRTLLDGQMFGSLVTSEPVAGMLSWSLAQGAKLTAPFLLFMFGVVAFAQFVQVGWHITAEPLKPNLSRLNPLAGLKRLLGRRNAVKTGVSIVKMLIVGVVVFFAVRAQLKEMAALPALGAVAAMMAAGRIVLDLAIWMLALLLLLGIADLAFQRWQRLQDLRMTKQEVKDERRSVEGDIETRARRLRMARQMLLQRMRQTVPTADVVVTNPTHFAVAIKYDSGSMHAPKVVAKGADYMAFRIREIAAMSDVPIVEKPPLARALYAGVEVGRFITPEFYQAVAEILAHVYRIKGKAA